MTPLEEAKQLYLKWELHRFGCEELGKHIAETDIIDPSKKLLLRDLLIFVISESLNNSVGRIFQNSNVRWRREPYHIEKLELANQVGYLPRDIHEVPLSEVIVRIPDLPMSDTIETIEKLRTRLEPHDYEPIIVVEPADRGTSTGARGTILDGNKRAIALALEGLTDINSIVGDRTP
jgi:hypothetical protein